MPFYALLPLQVVAQQRCIGARLCGWKFRLFFLRCCTLFLVDESPESC